MQETLAGWVGNSPEGEMATTGILAWENIP